jgi:hypothetical protein
MLAALPLIVGLVAVVLLWCLHQWNTPVWQLGIAGFVLSCGSMYAVWRIARKRATGRLAFSMRAMLIGMAVVAALLSTAGRWFLGTYRQHQALHAVGAYGAGVIKYDVRASDPRSWLYRVFGYDPFEGVDSLELRSDEALAAAVEQADKFPDVTMLSFRRGVTSAGFELARHFDKFPKLWIGEFMEASIDAEGLRQISQWKNPRLLFFNGCPNVTDAGLGHLTGITTLEELSLVEEGGGMVISDAGLVHIGQMKNLKELMLISLPRVTDAGLAHLHGLTNLEDLVIRRTAVTEAGIQQFFKALPDCRVVTDVPIQGPAEVQQIVVWRLGTPEVKTGVISDPNRIGTIRALVENLTDTVPQIDDRAMDSPLPSNIRLEFKGQTRTLYEVRIGNRMFQRNFRRERWTKWQLSEKEASHFLALLEQIETNGTATEE